MAKTVDSQREIAELARKLASANIWIADHKATAEASTAAWRRECERAYAQARALRADNATLRKIAAEVVETCAYSGTGRPPYCSFPVCRRSPYGWPPRDDWHNDELTQYDLIRRIQHAPDCPVTLFRALLAKGAGDGD